MCVACGCQVKSDKLWNAHILGRSHKEVSTFSAYIHTCQVALRKMKETDLKFPGFGPNSLEVFPRDDILSSFPK